MAILCNQESLWGIVGCGAHRDSGEGDKRAGVFQAGGIFSKGCAIEDAEREEDAFLVGGRIRHSRLRQAIGCFGDTPAK